jgi:hypothetical protein
MIRSGPFQKLNLRDHLRSHPNTFLHLLRSEALTPPPGHRFGKVGERAFCGSEMVEPLEHLTPCRRHEPGPHARRINKILAAVKAHYQRINTQIAGNVATHHELLPKVHPILAPEPGSLTRLVNAVGALGFSAFSGFFLDASKLGSKSALLRTPPRVQAAEKFVSLKGTAFRPYIIAV